MRPARTSRRPGFLALYDRLPSWVFQVAPAAGTLLVSLAVYFGGSNGADAYVMFYFWVAMAACYFLRPAGAFAHLALASAAYGVVLLVTPETSPSRCSSGCSRREPCSWSAA